MDSRIAVFFFFVKQKTAYEMRISDWSSDVCSSDLGSEAASPIPARRALRAVSGSPATKRYRVSAGGYAFAIGELPSLGCSQTNRPPGDSVFHSASADRSEEHTSELQSLMRISYAVVCLTNKN